MAATRYDPNAYMLLEIDPDKGSWRFLNADLVEWSTHYSKPYHAANLGGVRREVNAGSCAPHIYLPAFCFAQRLRGICQLRCPC